MYDLDPFELSNVLWPHYSTCPDCAFDPEQKSKDRWARPVTACDYHSRYDGLIFYSKQKLIISSVWTTPETIVPAGNMLGKDFVAGWIAVNFFLSRNPCRILTTSVDGDQLGSVLWGEIRRFIQSSKYPLDAASGGPLLINDLHIRKVDVQSKQVDPLSYILGRVAKKGEGMLGHHIAKTGDGIPRTLFIGDEASGLEDQMIDTAKTWADRVLLIGNPYDCENYFRRACREGDIIAKF
jgi:hypothetical protein